MSNPFFTFVLCESKETLVNGKRSIKLTFHPSADVNTEIGAGKLVLFLSPEKKEKLEESLGAKLISGAKFRINMEQKS